MGVIHSLERRVGPLAVPLLATLLLFAISAGISVVMYGNRRSSGLLTDFQLNNFFAYYQDLPVALPILLLLAAMLFVRLPSPRFPTLPSARLVAATMAAVLIGCFAGTRLLLGGFGLSMDEFMADFDADILRRGVLFADVPAHMRSMVDALQPIFLFKTAAGDFWSSSYLPGNAAIRALFDLAGIRSLASPALAAASAGLIYAVARKLQPEDRGFALVAMLFLVTSSQFLITAMTPYAMTAHLALNLAWLWLVLHDRRWSRAAALLVTFLACGLHQMIFHPLFVAPFLLWLWWSGKRGQAVLYGIATAAFALFWIGYWSIALAIVEPGAHAAGLLQVPLLDRVAALLQTAMRAASLAHSADNLLRLLTWQNPLLWVAVAAALLALRRLPAMAWALLGGVVLTIAAMLLLMPAQGHGWGYRYLHGLLGSLALLGAYGWNGIRDASPRADAWLAVSVAVSLLLLLPLRAWQVDAFVRPYRIADARIAAIPADIVLIDHSGRWFAVDLVRNDPHLTNRPLRMLAGRLSPEAAARLCRDYRVRVLSRTSPELSSLRATGFTGERRLRLLRGLGCG